MDAFRYVLTLRLYTGQKCYGPGVNMLLRAVEQSGSLRQAAAGMGMAYSKAWRILKNAQRELGFPLLVSSTGGEGGGGAKLTAEALELMEAYERFDRTLRRTADAAFADCFSGVRSRIIPPTAESANADKEDGGKELFE